MPRIYVRSFVVPGDAIDGNGHVNNLAYLRWMQDVALEHSAAQGWPLERYVETGTAWVVRSHSIEYLRPAFAGETVTALTWVAHYRRRSSPRRYLFWRESDGRVLAQAETLWVFVDRESGRPRDIPEEMRAAFAEVPDDDEALQAVRRGDPGALAALERAS